MKTNSLLSAPVRRVCVAMWAMACASFASAASVQITDVETSFGVLENLPGTTFEHDLTPATAVTFSIVVSAFPPAAPANVITIVEDGVVVGLTTQDGGFTNSTVVAVDYVPRVAGTKTIVVRATNGDTTATSAAIRLNVYGVAITSPPANAAAPLGSDVFISGPSLIKNGVVRHVDFYANGILVGKDSTGPYAVAWRPATAGSYTLTARVVDSFDHETDSPTVAFDIVPAVDNGTIQVAVSNPTSGSTVAAGSIVSVVAASGLTGSDGRVEQVQFYLDGVALGAPLTAFPFATNWAPAIAGTYSLTAIATDDKGNARASTPVAVTVTGNIPMVVLTSPADGISVATGSGLTLAALASGEDGSADSVHQVDFMVDGNVAFTDNAAPFDFSWVPTVPRATPYAITARVIATNGAQALSAPALVSVTGNAGIDAPAVTLSPNAVFSMPEGAARLISLSVTANSGRSVQRVEFLLDGVKLGEDTLAPYNWLLVAPFTLGTHRLVARAIDSANVASEASVPVEVTLPYGQAPTVTLQLPAAGATVAVGMAVNLSAVASDADGLVQSVVFLANGEPVLTTSAVPYAGQFYPTRPGTYTIGALATDDSGLTALSSATLTVTGQAQGTPTVVLTSPSAASASVTSGQRIVFEAWAASGSDDAWISRVEFLVKGLPLGTDGRQVGFTNTFRVSDVVLTTPGSYTITARVTDSRGVVANSANRQTLVVHAPVGAVPTVAIESPQLPSSGDLIVTNLSTLPLVAVVTDGDGTVSEVEFFVDRGQRAEATATITTQAIGPVTRSYVSAINVAQAGEGYLVIPDVVIDGDGSGAAAEITGLDANRGVAGIAVTSGGDGYTAATVRFVGGGLYEAQSLGHATKDPGGLGWRLTFNPGLLGAGPYRVYAVARDNDGNQTISSTLRLVIAGATSLPPSVTLTSSAASIGSGQSVNVGASAFDSDGTVASVEFFANATSIGKVTTGTWAQSWAPSVPGTYLLTAVATDNTGNTTVSNAAMLTVTGDQPTGLPPVVAILNPAGAVTVTRLSHYLFTALAFDPDNEIASVEFYRDGISLGTATREQTSTSYRLVADFAAVQTGSYQVTAVARDLTGNAAASEPVTVQVAAARSQPPTVAVQVSDATVNPGELVTLTANAVDADGRITGIQFFANGTAIGAETAPDANTGTSFTSITWSPATGGRYDIVALARDDTGNLTVSAAITITVAGQTQGLPTVTLTSPSAASMKVVAGQRMVFEATAVSGRANATVERVEFLVNGEPIVSEGRQVGFTNRYRVADYMLPTPGPYTIKARVTDSLGVAAESTNSQAVVVTTPWGAAPAVAIANPSAVAGGDSTISNLSTLPLIATATDTDGGVTDVEFFVDRGRRATGTVSAISVPPGVIDWFGIQVSDAGEGYLVLPKVSIQGDGTGARAIVTSLTSNGGVGIVSLLSGGSGYALGATVQFIGGGLYEAESIGHGVNDPSGLGWRLNVQPGLWGTGPYYLYAVARDGAGNQTVSAKVRVVVTGATSLPPAISVSALPTSAAAGQPVTLSASAFDSDGAVASIEFFVNSTSVAKLTNGSWAYGWTPPSPGTNLLTAVATDETGNTTLSPSVAFTVRSASPLDDDEAFVTQTYRDLLGRVPTSLELTAAAQISAGSLTRAQLVANITGGGSFTYAFQAALAYRAVLGEWPGYGDYAAGAGALSGGATLSDYVGALLNSASYVARYGTVPNLTTVNGGQYGRVSAFTTQIYQNIYGRDPALIEVQATLNDINTIGVNAAVASFLTAKFLTATDAAVAARVRAAALVAGLWRVAATDAEVGALSGMTSANAAAAALAEEAYTGRFFSVAVFPASAVVAEDNPVLLTAEVSGAPPFSYQWYRNGSPVPGAVQPALALSGVGAAQAGSYHVVVAGAEMSVSSATVGVAVGGASSRLANISTRGQVGTGDRVMIVGFVMSAGGSKPMLVRTAGPALASMTGLTGTLSEPQLELHAGSQLLGANARWGDNANLADMLAFAASTGAFSFAAGSADSALLSKLDAGVYTGVAGGVAGRTGLALVEVYDGNIASGGRVLNLSTRGFAGSGAQQLIAGFVVSGAASKQVLIRAVGPGLATAGGLVSGTVRDPRLELMAASGLGLRANDNWERAPEAALMPAAAVRVGAFPLAAGSADAALIANLAPGVYTVLVSGASASDTRIALVEVYDLDP